MLDDYSAEQVSGLLETISKPARLRILSAIGQAEACVCHLEAVLGLRQSYISQHLMALRSAGLLDTRREGRYVYYSLCDERILALIAGAAEPRLLSAQAYFNRMQAEAQEEIGN